MSILGKPTIYEIPSEATLRAPLAGLPELLQNKYDFNSHIFPNDLGTSENGHYAVFNINVPTNILGNDRGGFAGRFTAGFEAATPGMSKVDQLRFAPTSSGVGGGKPAAVPSTASSWMSWAQFLTLPGAAAEILRRANDLTGLIS